MESLYQCLYTDAQASWGLATALEEALHAFRNRTAVICIGTDSSIADALGPLVGTMLYEGGTKLPVYGTLERPVHARNFEERLRQIKAQVPGYFIIAVDASLGRSGEVGRVELKSGGLVPGRALHKKLPLIGDISVLGKVGVLKGWGNISTEQVRLGMVYRMARVIADAILQWERQQGL